MIADRPKTKMPAMLIQGNQSPSFVDNSMPAVKSVARIKSLGFMGYSDRFKKFLDVHFHDLDGRPNLLSFNFRKIRKLVQLPDHVREFSEDNEYVGKVWFYFSHLSPSVFL
jgi:hypothetical protein